MARAVWKGPFVEESLIKKVEKEKNNPNRKPIKTWSRKSTILPDFVGISFLIYNKPRAKIFLNDVGSIPIGYIIGFCILNLAKQSEWIMMISIFFYFIFDVTLTLIKKIQKGYYPWARLFDYQFLQPVLKGGKKHFFVLNFYPP